MLIMYNYGWITLKLIAKSVGAGGRSPSQSILKSVLENIDTGAYICYYKVFISMKHCVKFQIFENIYKRPINIFYRSEIFPANIYNRANNISYGSRNIYRPLRIFINML